MVLLLLLILLVWSPKVIIRSPNTPLLPEIIDGEEEWVVEEILDSRMINRKLHYLVKWDGFGIEHNSWEPWDNIHAPDLVSEFHRKHPEPLSLFNS